MSPVNAPPTPPMPPMHRAGLLLVALVVLAYLPVLDAGFIWDDDAYVEENETLRSADGLQRIWFEVGATPQYYPLVHTGFWIEYQLWGARPAPFHAVNVLLHALAALLLWRVLVRLELPAAWFAAALFALHPVQVESVAWITERKNVLSAVFYLAAALVWLGGRGRGRYGLATGLFVMALLSKTVTGSLPAALLLVTWWKQGQVHRADGLRLGPWFVLAVLFGLLTAWMEQDRVGAVGAEWDRSWLERVLVATRAVWFYAGKLVAPLELTFIYPRWNVDTTAVSWYLYPAALLALVGALWHQRQRLGRGPLVAVLLFVGTLFPALGFIDVYPHRYSFVADHFQYLATPALFALFAAACTTASAGLPPPGRRTGAAVLLLVLGGLSWQQTGIYRDRETLWRDTLSKNPDAWIAHMNLGNILRDRGERDAAFEHYGEAARINPASTLARYNLGLAWQERGQADAAIEEYRAAIEIEPTFIAAHSNLGTTLAASGRLDEAIVHFARAVELDPQSIDARFNLARAASLLGDAPTALEQFDAVLRQRPDWIAALAGQAMVLATAADPTLRDPARAQQLAGRAVELSGGNDPAALDALAAAHASAGDFARAVQAADRAFRLRPSAELRRRLELYRQRRPWIQDAAPRPGAAPRPR